MRAGAFSRGARGDTPRMPDRVVVLAICPIFPADHASGGTSARGRAATGGACAIRGVAGPEAPPGRSESEAPGRLWGACSDAHGELKKCQNSRDTTLACRADAVEHGAYFLKEFFGVLTHREVAEAGHGPVARAGDHRR